MKASRVIRRCATILSQRSVSLCALPQLNQLIPSHVTSIPMTTRSLTTSVPLVQARPPSSHPILTVPHRTMFIQTQTTPNPRSLKFIPGKPVLPDVSESGLVSASFDLNAKNAARKRCPLAWTLLLIDGVNNVMLGSDFVSVTISDSADWLVIKPQVFAAISEAYASGEPLLKSEGGSESEAQDSKTNLSNIEYAPEDEEAVRLIADIIDLRVRPSVMEDGGDVEFVKFDSNKIVWLKMMGSCSGCPSSGATLKQGIQNMLMHYVEEVAGVEEYVDTALEAVSMQALEELEKGLESAKTKDNKETSTDSNVNTQQ